MTTAARADGKTRPSRVHRNERNIEEPPMATAQRRRE
jgi:hypothetical protein